MLHVSDQDEHDEVESLSTCVNPSFNWYMNNICKN